MSTKIHTGFRFRSHDIFEIQRLIAEWRIELAAHHRSDLAALLAGMCTEIIDRNAVNPDRNAGKNPFREARREVRSRQKEVLGGGYRDPEVDFDFEIAILPHEGVVYGMLFSERSRWIDLWMERAEIFDFGYWDNGDRPDDLSKAEWAARGKTWNRILRSNPTATPGMAGFSAQCTDRLLQVSREEVIEHTPSFEDRLAVRGRECAMDKVYASMLDSGDMEEDNPLIIVRKIDDWLAGEGAHVLESERSRVAQLLSASITADMITSALPGETSDDV